MKFKIRFADQIVGVFIILSIVSLTFTVVMLGRAQQWFARTVPFYTTLPSAAGLTRNMAVQYRGFAIGNIRNFYLIDDGVIVHFTIHEEHRSRIREGSMVEVVSSPIGLGNQFVLHGGRGLELPDDAFVPVLGSPQARELLRIGLAAEPQPDDGISLLMSRAALVIDEFQQTLIQFNDAFGEGTDATEIGRIAGSLRQTLDGIDSDLAPILSNLNVITTELADPDGFFFALLDTEGEVYAHLMDSLISVASILDNLDRAAAFVPAQLPQLAGLIMDLRTTMHTAEGVLIALSNNPLLRRGIPERQETHSGSGNPRNIRF